MISNSSFFNNFGTDSEDTFTLMDYFGKDDTQEYTLEKIFEDFNFYEQIKLDKIV